VQAQFPKHEKPPAMAWQSGLIHTQLLHHLREPSTIKFSKIIRSLHVRSWLDISFHEGSSPVKHTI
jgi:hypothetical protein